MKHKAHVAIAALALGTSATAWAVPDACDDGAKYLTGVNPVATKTPATSSAYSASFVAGADYDYLGRSVATGDFNGDGVVDVAMGATGADVNGSMSGAVYVFFGGNPALSEGVGGNAHSDPVLGADVVIVGESVNDRSGFTLSTGDIDGDGLADLAIGSNAAAGSSGGAGMVHLLFGTSIATDADIDLATEADGRLFGERQGDAFGTVVSFIGDIDQDGYDDLAVGAPNYSRLITNRGAAYVFYGDALRTGGDIVATTVTSGRIEGTVAGGLFGSAIAPAHFFDSDLFPDFAVGAPGDNTAADGAGAAFVFAGDNTRLAGNISASTSMVSVYGRLGFRCGSSLLGHGDGDGDDRDDLWIGCKTAGSMKEGVVALVPGGDTLGAANVYDVQVAMIWGWGTNGLAGTTLAGGDVDNDGRRDLIVGGERATGDVVGSGATWIVYGPFPHGTVRTAGATTGATRGARIHGQAFEDFLGAAVAVGDVNDDGYDDVFTGAWRSMQWGAQRGVVAMFLGGADTADLVTFYQDVDNDGFGLTSGTELGCSNSPPVTGGYSWIRTPGDCDDSSAQFYPGAPELCANNTDNNCDGLIGAADQDFDGVLGCSNGVTAADCNDNNDKISPLKTEVCNGGIDDDCDGLADENDPTVSDATPYYIDADGDGYGTTASRTLTCTGTAPFPNAVRLYGDCDDSLANGINVNPAQPEVCGDNVDNDCANGADDRFAVDALTYWDDDDGDAYGDPTDPLKGCSRPLGYAENRQDCNDAQAAINPLATETCDYIDNNCDGINYHGFEEVAKNKAFATVLGADPADALRAPGFLGDQNGDGLDELIIVEDHNSDVIVNGGQVFVKFGNIAGSAMDMGTVRADGGGDWDARFYATRRDSYFGSTTARGDFNGDGTQDLAIGAPPGPWPNLSQGAVFIYYGPISAGSYADTEADVILRGAAGGHNFGGRLNVNDFDNDGYDDLLVAARTFTSTFSNQGRVYLVYGSASLVGNIKVDTLPTSNLRTFTGFAANDQVASGLASGDWDGDGYVDFMVGSATSGGGFAPGAVYLFYGSGSRPTSATLTPSSTFTGDPSEALGGSVANIGDTNADGRDDMAFGVNSNYVYVVLGRSTRFSGTGTIRSRFSMRLDTLPGINRQVVGLGDINLDTYDDFSVIAQDDDQGVVNDVGASYIVYGRPDWQLIVPNGGRFSLEDLESFGRVDPTGKLLPDGLPLVHSASSYNALEGVKIFGEKGSDGFGLTNGRGDYDGDGYTDFVIAAPGYDRSGVSLDNGKAYLFLGGGYGVDVFVTDNSARDWYRDYDADTWTTDQTLRACGMHRPISFKNPANPIPRAWLNPTPRLDCNDLNAAIYPGATESGGLDGVDQDCDGYDMPNVLPVITVVLNPELPLVSDTLTAVVTIDDSAETIKTPITLQYEWYKDNTGAATPTWTQIVGQTSSTLLPTNFTKGDRVQVRVRADDTRGVTAWKTAAVTIQNSKPTLDSCNVSPATAGVGTDLTVVGAGLADDDAGDQAFLTTTYQWQIEQFPAWANIPGQTATTLPSCTTRNVAETNPNAIYNCQRGARLRAVCTPRDPASSGTPVASAPITIQNTKPFMRVCAINPFTAYTNTDLTAVAVAEDPDVEAITISYEWVVNGSSIGSTGASLDASVTSHFDQVQLRCTPRDFYGDYGPTVTSTPVIIQNTPPTGVSIDLLPNFPRSNEDLYVNFTQVSSDIDGDAITYFYYWQKNGSTFLNPTYPSQVGTVSKSSIRKGETWTVTVVPNDGYADGPSATDSVLILNTAPSITSALVSPSVPESDDDLTAIGGGYFDWDGDPPQNKYQWWIDGAPVPGALGGTQQVLPKQPGRRGKQAYVTITADDGDALQDGNTITSGFVTYTNTPPYAPVLNPITPVQPGEDDDLACTFSQGSTDYDLDTVTYHVEWWRFRPAQPFTAPNGAGTYTRVFDYPVVTSTSGNQYTLPKTETEYADRFYCKVTPNDGFTDGPSVQTAEKGINDNDAPAQPTVNNIDRYRNGTDFTIAGTCQNLPNNCLDLHIACTRSDTGATLDFSAGATVYTDPSQSWCVNNAYSRTITGIRGVTYSCSAYCYDIGGNRSLTSDTSNERGVTQVCSATQYDPYEVYGTALSYGDTQGDAITGTLNGDANASAKGTMTQWGILADTNTSSISIVGNILGSGYDFTPVDVYDWYYIRSSDSYTTDIASQVNRYNFEVNMDIGAADYEMQVIRAVGATQTTMCPTQAGTNGAIGTFDDFNFYNWDRLDYPPNQPSPGNRNTDHGTPGDRQACDGNAIGAFNQCTDYTSDYYLRISRQTAQSCQNYRLQIRNGDASWL